MTLILGALAGTFLPYGLAAFIAMLPLLFFATAFIFEAQRACYFLLRQFQYIVLSSKENHLNSIPEANRTEKQKAFLKVMKNGLLRSLGSIETNAIQNDGIGLFFGFSSLFAILPAMGFGIYLAVKALPGVVAVITAKGISYGLALYIGGIVAGFGLIGLTFLVLTMPSLALLFIKYCQEDVAQIRQGNIRNLLPLVGKLGGFGFAAYLSTIIYPLMLTALSAFVPGGLAVFIALAVCVGLTLYLTVLMNEFASLVVRFFPKALAQQPDSSQTETGLRYLTTVCSIEMSAEALVAELYVLAKNVEELDQTHETLAQASLSK